MANVKVNRKVKKLKLKKKVEKTFIGVGVISFMLVIMSIDTLNKPFKENLPYLIFLAILIACMYVSYKVVSKYGTLFEEEEQRGWK